MPLILQENIENGEIGLWKITEEIEDLLSSAKLSVSEKITYSEISAHHRKKEWLATRALLNKLIYQPHLIKYHTDGRPYLENSTINISITHCTGFVAILLHASCLPGIDAEHTSRQVSKVASRFISPEELSDCSDKTGFSNRRMLMHWCAKEAIFKMAPISNIEFSNDIRIFLKDSDEDSGSFQGIFNYKSTPIPITLYYKIVDKVLIVWGWTNEVSFIH